MHWHRFDPGPDSADAACRALGVVDGRVVAAGGNDDDNSDMLGGRIWQAVDDGTWRAVADPEGLLGAEPGVVTIDAVTISGDVVVAVGSYDDGRGGGPCVWTGPAPGATSPVQWAWTRLASGGALQAVAARDDGAVVAVGDDGEGFACWRCADPAGGADAAGWARVPLDPAAMTVPGGAHAVAFGLVAHPGVGLIAVGGDVVVGSRIGAVWTSPDGTAWTRVAHDPAVFGGRGRNVLRAAATNPDGAVLAVGQGPDGAALWYSPDGVAWRRGPEDAVFGTQSDAEATAVVWRDGGWVVGGYLGAEAVVWTADDAGSACPAEWVRTSIGGSPDDDPDEGAAVFALHLAADGTLSAFGRDDDVAFAATLGAGAAPDAAHAWRMRDLVPAPDDDTASSAIWCGAATAQGLVVAGDHGDGAGVWSAPAADPAAALTLVADPGEVFLAPSEVCVVGFSLDEAEHGMLAVGDRGDVAVAWRVVDGVVVARRPLPLPEAAAAEVVSSVAAAAPGPAGAALAGAVADDAVLWRPAGDVAPTWRAELLAPPDGVAAGVARAEAIDREADGWLLGGHVGAEPVVWEVAPDGIRGHALGGTRNGFGRVHGVAVRADGIAVAVGRAGTAAGFWRRAPRAAEGTGIDGGWQPVAFDKVAFGGADLVTADAVCVRSDGVFVAAGGSEHAGRRRLRVWTSPDGAAWRLEPDAAFSDGSGRGPDPRSDRGWPFADVAVALPDGNVAIAGSDTAGAVGGAAAADADATVAAVWIGTPSS